MLYDSVVDPEWFIPDPGPTFQGIRIQITRKRTTSKKRRKLNMCIVHVKKVGSGNESGNSVSDRTRQNHSGSVPRSLTPRYWTRLTVLWEGSFRTGSRRQWLWEGDRCRAGERAGSAVQPAGRWTSAAPAIRYLVILYLAGSCLQSDDSWALDSLL